MAEITDEELEASIDRVGRDRVFARVREVGWSEVNPPPKWVWNCIVAELTQNDLRTAARQFEEIHPITH